MMDANVLLVDDEKAFVETMAKRLNKRKLNIAKAFSGEQALEHLSLNPKVEVVILDVKMAGMDGEQVLKTIKNRHPLIEVIMLTGHATVESGIEGMKSGAFDYLTKPCDMEILIAKVDEAANKKRRHEEKILEASIREITSHRP
ncbi:MAG: response regulator [Desulfobacteraceae bacterium]|nr:response regulator [Desulfobacteraceae bacterium]